MWNPLARKLHQAVRLTADDEKLLDSLVAQPKRYESGEMVVAEGDTTNFAHVVIAGAAARFKLLPDGRRQNVALLLPGDLCDLHGFLLRRFDHSIDALVGSEIAPISRPDLLLLLRRNARLRAALRWNTIQDKAIMREWLLNIGRRRAYERMAHMFFEIYLRLNVVGLVDDNTFTLPLNQSGIGDTLGLSLMHVNRSLNRLRKEGLIDLDQSRKGSLRVMTILDLDGLQAVSDYDDSYLHLDGVRDDVE